MIASPCFFHGASKNVFTPERRHHADEWRCGVEHAFANAVGLDGVETRVFVTIIPSHQLETLH